MAGECAPSSRRQRGQGACCVLLLLSLLMLAVFRTASRRFFSMASGAAAESSYVPGSLSAAFITCPNEKVAKELARAVVEKRLAACVNVVPQITSIYEWKGKIEEDAEVLLMIKTRSSRIPALTEFVRSLHPYEVAEVIAVPILQGNPPYLRWVEETVPE